METISFATKRKRKNCVRSYPCGNSCISRSKSCRKVLKGQAKNFASWLQKQAGALEKDFQKETLKRLNNEISQLRKLKIKKTEIIETGDKDLDKLFKLRAEAKDIVNKYKDDNRVVSTGKLNSANTIKKFERRSPEQIELLEELKKRVNQANRQERELRVKLDDEIRKRDIPRQTALDDLSGELSAELKRRTKTRKNKSNSTIDRAKKLVLDVLESDFRGSEKLIKSLKKQRKSIKNEKERAELEQEIAKQEKAKRKAQKELEKKRKEWGIDS